MNTSLQINRAWAMPSKNTFSIKPIHQFTTRYCAGKHVIVDPFARDSSLATITNDLNPNTSATYHLDAVDFLDTMIENKVKADVVLLDPPYSPRQIKECYESFGRKMTQRDALRAEYIMFLRDRVAKIVKPNGVVLSYGWNSSGMGLKRGWELFDMLVVCHGGDHNDTICIAERRASA